MTIRKFRVIILGAGFSKAAGLPLGTELWQLILERIKYLSGRAAKLNDDIEAYIQYRRACDGITLTPETVNFEEFLGFLDVEHHLWLRGSDTWSNDGNEGQVVVKTLIGEILTQYMPLPTDIPNLYLEFARRLEAKDVVLTFNYDVLLERALDAVGKSYRLFPNRYVSVLDHGGIIDPSREEVVILKLHGSIDWFDKSQYLETQLEYVRHNIKHPPSHPVFSSSVDWGLTQVIDSPRFDQDPLRNVYRVADIEGLYQSKLLFLATPMILNPSTNKIVYFGAFRDFWSGLSYSGEYNFGMALIGYSLPSHDNYARQVIYSLVTNYQAGDLDSVIEPFGLKKSPLVLVDHRPTLRSLNEYRSTYRFVDFKKAFLRDEGFGCEVLDDIFA